MSGRTPPPNGVDEAGAPDQHARVPRSLSLVLPAFDEARSIVAVVEEAHRALALARLRFEIVVVDDGSTDDTSRLVTELASSLPDLRLVRLHENRGYGAALRAGFAAARMEAVGYMDSDGQLDPSDLARLLDALARADLAAGVRANRAEGSIRWALSRAYNGLATRTLAVAAQDLNCALKLVRREVIELVSPRTDGYLGGAEIVARARVHGLRVVEIPVRHRPRLFGRSKVTVRRSLAALVELASLRGRLLESVSPTRRSEPPSRPASRFDAN